MQDQSTPPQPPKDLSDAILEGNVKKQQEKAKLDPRTVEQFVHDVELNVEKDVKSLESLVGPKDGVAEKTRKKIHSYKNEKQEFLQPTYKIVRLRDQGLAGRVRKDEGNIVELDDEIVGVHKTEKDKHECRCIAEHERKHKEMQAGRFNADRVEYRPKGAPKTAKKIVVTAKSLLEGHASSHQPDEHLTPDYQRYKNEYEAIVEHLGTDKPIEKALKTGDLLKLERQLNRKAAAGRQAEHLEDEEPGPEASRTIGPDADHGRGHDGASRAA